MAWNPAWVYQQKITRVVGWRLSGHHVNSTKRADAFTKQALKLMDEGFT